MFLKGKLIFSLVLKYIFFFFCKVKIAKRELLFCANLLKGKIAFFFYLSTFFRNGMNNCLFR